MALDIASTMQSQFPAPDTTPALALHQRIVHRVDAVTQCLARNAPPSPSPSHSSPPAALSSHHQPPPSTNSFKHSLLQRLPHLSSPTPFSFYSSSSTPLCSLIDHTLLKAEATDADITRLCHEAIEHHFKAVCVNAYHLPHAHHALTTTAASSSAASSSVSAPLLAVVVGFPLGASPSSIKAAECAWAVAHGADEIDMVINVSALLCGHYQYVLDDIQAVTHAAAAGTKQADVKVIVESAMLTTDKLIDACLLAALAGASFVKTSTGFHSAGGATVAAVRVMRAVVADRLHVKASGGIRDATSARLMIDAGADRLGLSASIAIVQQAAQAAAAPPPGSLDHHPPQHNTEPPTSAPASGGGGAGGLY